jgi:hypothetical protein
MTEDCDINVYSNFKTKYKSESNLNLLDDKKAHVVTFSIFNHITFMLLLSD